MVTRDSTTEVLHSGLIMEKIPGLKRRQRSKYYRRITVKGGEMIWMQTELLPSDVEGQAYYRAKGFRLEPPEGAEFALNNTARQEEVKAEIEAEVRTKIEAENKGIMDTLMAEIASLREEVKGKQEGSDKAGRPRKVGG